MSLENLKCPDCSGPMVPRTNKIEKTKFWGCKRFPDCKGTRDSEGLSKEERNQEVKGEDDNDYGLPSERNKGRSRRYD